MEMESGYRNPFYIPSIGKDVDKNSPLHVREEEYYQNEELQTLVKLELLKIKKTTGRLNQQKTEEDGLRKTSDNIFGVRIPDNFEHLHWKQQRKILESINQIDLFKIILAVAKEGNFKELAKKRIIDIQIGKK